MCRIKYGDKEITIRIQRPDFNDLKNTYEAIDNVERNEAETYNRMEANLAGNIALVEKRYEVIGGQAYREFMNKKINLYNTCALRVSYALNYSTHSIKNMKKQVVGRGYKGKESYILFGSARYSGAFKQKLERVIVE